MKTKQILALLFVALSISILMASDTLFNLTQPDGPNVPGIYKQDGTTWVFQPSTSGTTLPVLVPPPPPPSSGERSGTFYVDQGNSCYVPQNIAPPLVKEWEVTQQATMGPFQGNGLAYVTRTRNYGGNGIQYSDAYGIDPTTGKVVNNHPSSGGSQLESYTAMMDQSVIGYSAWHSNAAYDLSRGWKHLRGLAGVLYGARGIMVTGDVAGGTGIMVGTSNWGHGDVNGWSFNGSLIACVLRFDAVNQNIWTKGNISGTFAGSSDILAESLMVPAVKLSAIEIRSGKVLWDLPTKSYSGLISISDGLVYAKTDGNLKAIDLLSGQVKWTSDTPLEVSQLAYPPAIGADYVVVCQANKLTAFNRSTGSFIWQRIIPALITPPLAPVITGSTIWIPTGTTLIGYSLSTGEISGATNVGQVIYGLCVVKGRIVLRTGPTAQITTYTVGTTKLMAFKGYSQ
jgi:outer membrane protein assembly factor BamB